MLMEKSPEAFRTIREVAEDMDLPQHVLRFWESRFPQIRPLKRAGGRRYYRPDDIDRLRLIKRLLYEEGYTIRGVQKLFREQGAQTLIHEMSTEFAQPLDPARASNPGAGEDDGAYGEALEAPGGEGEPALGEPVQAFPDQRAEAAPLPVARPTLSARDVDTLKGVLADIREAQRVLAQAKAPKE
jgi:DNA-binding transcriptional MerR regulator